MSEAAVIAPVRKTVSVKAPIEHAFEVLTSGLTRWWPFEYGVGKKPIKNVIMEPRLGGRWLEISDDGTETTVATIILVLWRLRHDQPLVYLQRTVHRLAVRQRTAAP